VTVDFVSVDFETANGRRGSPCAVGLARVRNNRVVDSRTLLMRPPAELDAFCEWNTRLHGIRAEDVRDKPRFAQVFPDVLAYIGADVVVAHNACFDLGVIRDACTASGLPWPKLTYACTLVLARLTYDLPSYTLPFAAEAANASLRAHHDQQQDAVAAAQIMIDIGARQGTDSVAATLVALGVVEGQLDPNQWSGSRLSPGDRSRRSPLPDADPDADPGHPLFGKYVAFTGMLQRMSRPTARERVARCGGQPQAGPTKQTDMLIQGLQDPTRLRLGVPLSAKSEKALQLRSEGSAIELLSEIEFLAFLDDERISGSRRGTQARCNRKRSSGTRT
jgi:DNA polymerase III epsilon subunit-like protein